MGLRHNATVLASYSSTIESNSESENDDDLTNNDDSDGNEAGSEIEAIKEATCCWFLEFWMI